jgi:uncharacterized membrane protein HdeD (DUF308 family)
MTLFQKKIAFTFLPYILGYAIAYALLAFTVWDRDAGHWMFSDRLFGIILGWVLGSMLYVRFEHDRVR